MKYLLGTIWILIGLILWIIILISSFILRTCWDFNINNYDFEFQWDYYTRKTFPFCAYSIFADEYYSYNSYFHYLFNIKKSIKW